MRFFTGSVEVADWIGRTRSDGSELLAPELVLVEVANALVGYVRVGRMDVADALECLSRLDEMVQRVPLSGIFPDALVVALDRGLTAYDAAYVVLAEELRAPLLTADRKLAAATERAVIVD